MFLNWQYPNEWLLQFASDIKVMLLLYIPTWLLFINGYLLWRVYLFLHVLGRLGSLDAQISHTCLLDTGNILICDIAHAQTILLVPVLPHGVLQLGSLEAVSIFPVFNAFLSFFSQVTRVKSKLNACMLMLLEVLAFWILQTLH